MKGILNFFYILQSKLLLFILLIVHFMFIRLNRIYKQFLKNRKRLHRGTQQQHKKAIWPNKLDTERIPCLRDVKKLLSAKEQ